LCPRCRGKLVEAIAGLRCDACNRLYELRRQIPDFLLETPAQTTNPVLRRVKSIDRLAAIYESKLWYPFVLDLFGGFGCVTLPQLIAIVRDMAGSVGGRVLDVATGPGTFGRRIASPSRRVYGIDISLGMLDRGVEYSKREHITNICFVRAMVEALPFGDEVFDAELCCGSLHLFPDTAGALREMARTLKPGARLIAVTVCVGSAGLVRFPRVRRRLHRRGLRVFAIAELESELSQAGFANFRPAAYGSILTFSAEKASLLSA
jgi:SAM-dependent methyltransferase